MLKIGIDIDDTITKHPKFFSFLTNSIKNNGGMVYIISSRVDSQEVHRITEEELHSLNILFDDIYLLPDRNMAEKVYPHPQLDWYEKYIYQKVDYCKKQGVEIYFDDEDKVIKLFKKYAKEIQVFQIL